MDLIFKSIDSILIVVLAIFSFGNSFMKSDMRSGAL